MILFNEKGPCRKERVRWGIKFYFHLLKFEVFRYPCRGIIWNMLKLELRRAVRTVSSFIYSETFIEHLLCSRRASQMAQW